MGNKPILNRPAPTPASQPGQPGPAVSRTMLWDVFVMRREGRRLPREDVKPLRCMLTISKLYGPPTALLSDRHGNNYGRLDDIQIRQMLPSGALLLRGVQCVVHSTQGVKDHPQSWWCVPVGFES